MNESENVNNDIEPKSIRPRSLVFAIISVICIVLISAFYMSNRISSTLSQASTNNGLAVSNITKEANANQTVQQHSNSQNQPRKSIVIDGREDDTALSYHDFKQEAQNVLFREEEKIIQAKYSTHGLTPAVSAADFKIEAHKTLYRESSY
ncbi:hypothetical protein JCM18901_1078 [Psychrobacter sp. JCM 18901]|uniref:hypothetical protein n=1 Tax=Psychrobacter sp. JCM 18901 TaxID=1298609 RepID=UPI000433DBB9|nr:hypothetical protein [Psychrobacter sp. JCM 18901]GAF55432.1 hypothetical protein JCM18901_1078 [Psychrobacter sp. JCM 18901]